MTTIRKWTGREAGMLRAALRMSVRGFADHLGVAPRTVSKWHELGEDTVPHPDTQAILDTALARADSAARARFESLMHGAGAAASTAGTGYERSDDYEAWSEDLDRTILALSWQNFSFARELLGRWIHRFNPHELDERGLYLYGRSLTLLGDFHADQGALSGPLSASSSYIEAREIFRQLDVPRRVAQLDLSLAVVAEMSGDVSEAQRLYEALAEDRRLSARDRGRARLWVGTALTKNGEQRAAIEVMGAATREFEVLGEPEDWCSAQQKIALAYRGIGDLAGASRYIEIARGAGNAHSPLQRVQLDTATAHILLSDPASAAEGEGMLARAETTASQFKLGHQLRSIHTIRNTTAATTRVASATQESP